MKDTNCFTQAKISHFFAEYNVPSDENIEELKKEGVFKALNGQIFEIVLFLSIALNWLNNIPIFKKYGIRFNIDDVLDYHYQNNDFSEIWVITLWNNFYNATYDKLKSKNLGLDFNSNDFWKIIRDKLLHQLNVDYSNYDMLVSVRKAPYYEFVSIQDFNKIDSLSEFLFYFCKNFLYKGVDEILINHCSWYDDTDTIEHLDNSRTIEATCNFIRVSGDNFNCFFLTDTDTDI